MQVGPITTPLDQPQRRKDDDGVELTPRGFVGSACRYWPGGFSWAKEGATPWGLTGGGLGRGERTGSHRMAVGRTYREAAS